MDKDYIQRLQAKIPEMETKLKEIEKIFGLYSERWHIANANLIRHKEIVKHGIPKHIEQSTEIPYDTINEF